MNADRFLDMFRELEEMLALQYPPSERRYNSPIMDYINDTSNALYREEMNTCREIRNLLTHHADIGGKAIVEPSDEVMSLLDKIVQHVSDPPTVMCCATPFNKLMVASPQQSAFSVMHKMKGRGFSHVPVLSGGKFVGVFSVSTPFSYALKNDKGIKRDITIGDFGDLLKTDNHCTERYLFIPETMTIRKAGKLFEIVGNDKKRLAMMFITENGKENEQILGVLTPFDVLHINENE